MTWNTSKWLLLLGLGVGLGIWYEATQKRKTKKTGIKRGQETETI